MKLTILTITKAQPYALDAIRRFADLAQHLGARLVVAADGLDATERARDVFPLAIRVQSMGYLENVLDDAVRACPEGYILRLDDDEQPSAAMVAWLGAGSFVNFDHWKFPRVHLWQDQRHALKTPTLWPDWQTRLSIKAKSGGRPAVHSGSPFGGGAEAPVAIEHLKFLLKDENERHEIARSYDRFCSGYGTGDGMRPFSLPERSYSPETLAEATVEYDSAKGTL